MKYFLKPKTTSRTKEQLSFIGQMAETSMREPDTSGLFFHFVKMRKHLFIRKILSDYGITRPRGT